MLEESTLELEGSQCFARGHVSRKSTESEYLVRYLTLKEKEIIVMALPILLNGGFSQNS